MEGDRNRVLQTVQGRTLKMYAQRYRPVFTPDFISGSSTAAEE